MSVADQLGLDGADAAAFVVARTWWMSAKNDDATLGVVDDLADLPSWTRQASRDESNVVLVVPTYRPGVRTWPCSAMSAVVTARQKPGTSA